MEYFLATFTRSLLKTLVKLLKTVIRTFFLRSFKIQALEAIKPINDIVKIICRRRSTSARRDSCDVEQQDADSSKQTRDRDVKLHQATTDRSRGGDWPDDRSDRVKESRDEQRQRVDRRSYDRRERDERYSGRSERNDRRHRRERDNELEADDRNERSDGRHRRERDNELEADDRNERSDGRHRRERDNELEADDRYRNNERSHRR
jgi:hypothetical protein